MKKQYIIVLALLMAAILACQSQAALPPEVIAATATANAEERITQEFLANLCALKVTSHEDEGGFTVGPGEVQAENGQTKVCNHDYDVDFITQPVLDVQAAMEALAAICSAKNDEQKTFVTQAYINRFNVRCEDLTGELITSEHSSFTTSEGWLVQLIAAFSGEEYFYLSQHGKGSIGFDYTGNPVWIPNMTKMVRIDDAHARLNGVVYTINMIPFTPVIALSCYPEPTVGESYLWKSVTEHEGGVSVSDEFGNHMYSLPPSDAYMEFLGYKNGLAHVMHSTWGGLYLKPEEASCRP